jgi:hypothetical protein
MVRAVKPADALAYRLISGEHRPVWISPHVKGPADKPFVAKDRVIAWVR